MPEGNRVNHLNLEAYKKKTEEKEMPCDLLE